MATKRKADPSPSGSEAKKSTGHAVFTYDNEDKLECEVINRRAKGKGKKTFANGDMLECDGWKNGVANGKGKMTIIF
jgi:hypothetical protein